MSHHQCLQSTFVNSGSGDVRSMGNNWVTNFDNNSGLNYITPTLVTPI